MGSDTEARVQQVLLERLQTQINLPAWLVARGFHVAPLQPDPGQIVMIGPGREALQLRKDVERGGWTYANSSNSSDRGTVVDFMIKHEGATVEGGANRLAGCVVRSHLSPEGIAYHEALRDRGNTLHPLEALHITAVKVERETTRALERFGVDRSALDETRFGRIRDSNDVEALFRNPETLHHSRYRPGDQAIVFVERPIDAIAYERAHGRGGACYVYTGEKPSPDTRRKIVHLLTELPGGMKVVLALGRDRGGGELAADLAKLMPALKPERHAPEYGGRWFDQMQIEQRHKRSLHRSVLAPSRSL